LLADSQVTITDFELGQDMINQSHLAGLNSFSEVMEAMSQAGDDAVISYDDASLTLVGVDLDDLGSNDFIF